MEKTYFNHKLHDDKGRRSTVCAIFDDQTRDLKIGIAVCSKKDSFMKKRGRLIAKSRAVKDPIFNIKLPENVYPSLSLKKIGHAILNKSDIPSLKALSQ